ncbi:hypothetical protein Unana1_08910 [Umbelopsis nana]
MSIPTTMNAVIVEKVGSPDNLKYTQVPVPTIKNPTDILIKVKAAAVNPVEAKFRNGNFVNFLIKKNAILGADYSGIVVQKGDKVTKFDVGDAVFGKLHYPIGPQGSYAEYIVVGAGDKAITKKPDYLSFEDAASFGIAFLTALAAILKAPLPLEHKQGNPVPKILVIGASGGVGTFGVLLGKAIGADVVGICSAKNGEFVKSHGASRTVDYNNPSALDTLASEKETYDLILDTVGGDDYYNKLVHVLKKNGLFATAAGPQEHVGSKNVGLGTALSLVGSVARLTFFGERRYYKTMTLPEDKFDWALSHWLPGQKINPAVPPENILPLKNVAEAHRRLETHRVRGKIVISVDPEQ